MSSWPPRRPDREAASAAAEFPGAGCRSLRGRPSGLKTACGIATRRPCGPALTPETTAAPDGSTKGQATACPRRPRHPGAKPLTVYGWRGKGHLPALLRRSLEHAQYTSIRYAERLGDIGAVRSVGSKGDSYDNAAAESVNSLYKKELIDLDGPWNSVRDVTFATMEWVAWYNSERLHSTCGYVPPKEFEENYYIQQDALVA